MNETTEKLFNCGVIPVIKLHDETDAVPLCDALLAGGIDVAEVTFRTPAAAAAIKKISESLPEVFVGAGTVINVELAKKAVEAGAKFIISPGLNQPVVEYCLEQGVPVYPGVSSPTDIEKGLAYGLEVLKFFPAEANGGIAALKAMSAPYGNLKFMPTGGIDAKNLLDYLSFDRVIACGGSFMVSEKLIQAKRFDEVTALTKEAVLKMHNFSFVHIGINSESKTAADISAERFASAFGFAREEKSASIFAGKQIEIMNMKGLGANGHIGIRTTNVKRAMAYLTKKGFAFNSETLRGTEEKPTFVYLKDEIAGFAIHLVE